ncbi:transmembrane protease serine 5 isoform X2 [Delphinapterus leucas]|uniref:Transmembrane protease serine 5 isoform X2 n=2 Tax=Delphinapterus leucas TaxID=9749 RepID=A0A2Y9M6Y1_DELLE|nr:transmembrane protease serine 5 isoform X2 [Delphinapterus leucas]
MDSQSLMLDGQAPMEAQYAEESPGSWIFRAEPGDPLRRPEARQQPISWAGRWCTGRRGWAALGALVLLAGASIGSWLLALYLWPAAPQPVPGTLQDEDMSLNCSEASGEEALLPSLPRAVSFRINTEDFLLEVQVRARPDWLLVCHEGWSSALGVRICQSLGHLRLTDHKAVNLSDIRLNSSRQFAQLSPRLGGLPEEVWQPRGSCTSGQMVSLRCSGSAQLPCAVSGCPAGPAGGSIRGWSARARSGRTRGLWWSGSSPTLCTVPRVTTTTWPSCSSGPRSTSQTPWAQCACRLKSRIFQGARSAGCLAGATLTPVTPTGRTRSGTRWFPCSAPSSATALACTAGPSRPACCVPATWTRGPTRARGTAGVPWCAWTRARGAWWGWSAGAAAAQSPTTPVSTPRLPNSWTGSRTRRRSTRWRRSCSPGCRRCGSLITAQETVTTHWPASRPQGLSTPALISSPSISPESLNDRREAGVVLGRSGSQEVGREQLERRRVLAAVGSLPFCPLPAPQPLCASFGRMLRDALGLPSPCDLRRGDASLQTQVGKLLGRWGQGWTGPGEAHGVRIRPTLLSISPTSCSHLALTGPAGAGAHSAWCWNRA